MRGRGLLLLGFAVALGGVAVYLARDYIEERAKPVVVEQPSFETTTVVVARTPLYFGNRISRQHLREVAWPANSVPPGSFTKIDEVLGSGEERVVLREVEQYEPLLQSKVSGFGGRGTLSARVDKEMRAVTIRVNDVLGVAGFVMPGDRVDILLTRDISKDNPITDVLLQNVKVLGIDQDASDQKENPKVVRAVTLEVTPPQTQKLMLASQVGTLALALRNAENFQEAKVRTISIRDLSVGETLNPSAGKVASKSKARSKVTVRAHRPDPRLSVSIYRGTERSEETVTKDRGDVPARAATGAPTSILPSGTAPKPSDVEKAPEAGEPAKKDSIGPMSLIPENPPVVEDDHSG